MTLTEPDGAVDHWRAMLADMYTSVVSFQCRSLLIGPACATNFQMTYRSGAAMHAGHSVSLCTSDASISQRYSEYTELSSLARVIVCHLL